MNIDICRAPREHRCTDGAQADTKRVTFYQAVSKRGRPGCSGDSANPSSISIKKNGGGTAQIGVTASNTGTVTVSAPINLQVTPANQTVAGGGTVNFSITSLNNARGTFAVNFNTPCTTLTVLVTVTN